MAVTHSLFFALQVLLGACAMAMAVQHFEESDPCYLLNEQGQAAGACMVEAFHKDPGAMKPEEFQAASEALSVDERAKLETCLMQSGGCEGADGNMDCNACIASINPELPESVQNNLVNLLPNCCSEDVTNNLEGMQCVAMMYYSACDRAGKQSEQQPKQQQL